MSSHHPTDTSAPDSTGPRSLAPTLKVNEPAPRHEQLDPFTIPPTRTREVDLEEEGEADIEGSTEVVFGRGRLPNNKTTDKVSKGPSCPSSPTPLAASSTQSHTTHH